MSAVRPLATIAMLMVLGVFLWNRINTPDLKEETEDALASADAPALETDLGPDADTMGSAPPPFSPAEPVDQGEGELPEFDFGPAPPAEPEGDIAPLDEQDIAAMPELPPLPDNVPTADYQDSEEKPADTDIVAGPVPNLGNSVPDSAIGEQGAEAAPASPDAVEALAGSSADAAPLGQDNMDPYANSTPAADSAVSGEFAEASPFAAAKPQIDAALAQGDLGQAHRLLSRWYGDRTLPLKEQEEIESLLSQLAGTVIYSTDHRLEAPHRVQAGETLETIAQQYNVPWQLLAKINGVAQPSAVTPGQELKVIRGPFSAVVDAENNQMALMVADCYAGEFGVKVEGAANNEGEWVVTQKQIPEGDSKRLVLEDPTGLQGGPQLVLGPPSDTAPATAGAIRVAPTDQEDLFDILSIGSRVLIRK